MLDYEKNDEWMCGYLLHSAISSKGHGPYPGGIQQEFRTEEYREPDRAPDDIDPALRATIRRLLVVEPAERIPSADALLNLFDSLGEACRD